MIIIVGGPGAGTLSTLFSSYVLQRFSKTRVQGWNHLLVLSSFRPHAISQKVLLEKHCFDTYGPWSKLETDTRYSDLPSILFEIRHEDAIPQGPSDAESFMFMFFQVLAEICCQHDEILIQHIMYFFDSTQ